MNIREAVTLPEIYAVLLVRIFRQTSLVKADHVGPELVHVSRVGKVHHIGHVTAAGTHVYFQSHEVSNLSQPFFGFGKLEEFHVDEAAFYTKGFHCGATPLLQLGFHGRRYIEDQFYLLVYDVHDGRGYAHGLKKHVALGIHYGVVGANPAVYIFFHYIGVFRFFCEEGSQIFLVFQAPGSSGAYAVFRFHDDGVANLFNKLFCFFLCGDRGLSARWHTGFFIIGLHGGLAAISLDFIYVRTGEDVEIRSQHGVMFQPVFIVGFQPVDLAVFKTEKSYGPKYLVIIFQGSNFVIFCQALFQFRGQVIIGGIADTQHVGSVLLQSVTPVPVGAGKLRGDKDKVHIEILSGGSLIWRH